MYYSDEDRKIIEKIIDVEKNSKKRVLGNIFENGIENSQGFYIDVENIDTVGVYIKEDYYQFLTTKYGSYGIKIFIERVQDNLRHLVRLLISLEQSHLITFSGKFEEKFLGIKFENTKYITFFDIDDETKDYLVIYSKKIFTPEEELKQLVKNKYLTKEEINNIRQLRYTRIGLILNAFAVIISVIALIITQIQTQHLIIDNKELKIVSDKKQTIDINLDQAFIEKFKKDLIENSKIYIQK